MTHDDVMALMEAIKAATGCEFAYDHFAEGESPDPPFLCFLYPEAAEFGADNIVYHSFSHLDIELYTDLKDPELEQKVEAVLTGYELFFHKSEVWIEEEKMYNAAIQQKSIAQQNADRQKIENAAAIAKAEADKQVAITNAEAEAQKTAIKAEAQAEANKKIAESLSDTLIEYQKIQKWDGKLPTVTGSTALVGIDAAE